MTSARLKITFVDMAWYPKGWTGCLPRAMLVGSFLDHGNGWFGISMECLVNYATLFIFVVVFVCLFVCFDEVNSLLHISYFFSYLVTKGAFVWDQSGIRIIGIMKISVRLGAILIPEYLDFHSGYSAPRSRIAGIYSGIYSYSRISQTNAP